MTTSGGTHGHGDGGTCYCAVDARDYGELNGGGATTYWSPEHGRRRALAAARGGLRREHGREQEGGKGEVPEDGVLTLSVNSRPEKGEELGRR